MELSIIIPSIRQGWFNNFVKHIHERTDVEYEIIENHEVGNLYSIINDCFKKATGRYFAVTCDDMEVGEHWASRMIQFLESQDVPTLGNFSFISDDRGTSHPIDVKYFGLPCAIIPFTKRENIIGDLFDTRFKRFFGDIDLSLRFYQRGLKVATCPTAYVNMLNNRDKIKREAISAHFKNDEAEFNKKWANYDFNLLGYQKTA